MIIPISRILDDIYAESALSAILTRSSDKPSVLSPDNSEALKRIIVVAATQVAAELIKHLKSVRFPESPDSDPQLEFEFNAPKSLATEALAEHLTSALIFKTMSLVALQGCDYRKADAYSVYGDCYIKAICSCLYSPTSIKPHYY